MWRRMIKTMIPLLQRSLDIDIGLWWWRGKSHAQWSFIHIISTNAFKQWCSHLQILQNKMRREEFNEGSISFTKLGYRNKIIHIWVAFACLWLVTPNIDVRVRPNPRPCIWPCLSRPITYLYISSTNSEVDEKTVEKVDDEDSLISYCVWVVISSSNLAYKKY